MMGAWLARLKNQKSPDTHATKPTKPPQGEEKAGFVGFVAYPPAPFAKIKLGDGAAIKPQATAANEAVQPDPAPGEREPRPVAMSAAELATFARRVERFTMRGLCAEASEREAYRLAARDRDGDDRRLCLECLHLRGIPQAWRCGNAWRAGIGGPALPSDLAGLLQRCPGFAAAELEGPSCA